MKFSCKILLPCVGISLLAGCASHVPNVDASQQFWQNKQQTVAIAKTPAQNEKAKFYSEGDQGLLDEGLTELANSSVRKTVSQYDATGILPSARAQLIAALKAHHINAKVVGVVDRKQLSDSKLQPTQYSTKNYHQLSALYGSDKLLTLTFDQLGVVHRYESIISVAAPQAVCTITGRLVNLKDNHIIWRHQSTFVTNIDKPYDDSANIYSAIQYASQNSVQDLVANFTKNAKA